jgi:putative DNA-invertase from lambdoid prophage Rac
MSVILYARVSTNGQELGHQRTQAEEAGFKIDEVVSEKTSGITTTLAERPQGKRLYDILRKGDTLVVRWVDRLGRNYDDVSMTIRDFMRRGVIIRTVINNMTFNGATKDPIEKAVRDAVIGFMAATAEAQAEATKEAQRAGIKAARKKKETMKYLGRKPSYDRKQYQTVIDMLAQGAGTSEIARTTNLSRQTVLRIKADPEASEKILASWEEKRERRL